MSRSSSSSLPAARERGAQVGYTARVMRLQPGHRKHRFPACVATLPLGLGLGLVFCLAFIASLAAASAQPSEIHGVVTGEGAKRIQIAIPPTSSSGPLAALASEMHQTLIDDLAYSGYFTIVDPALYASLKAPATDGASLAGWRSASADAVLTARIEPQGDQLALEGRLFDATSSEMVLGKRYAGEREIARRIAHRLAADVTMHFTGQSGVSLTNIVFVSQHGDGKELYVMDYDGQRIRRLTTTGTINLSPAWSPVDRRLAFLSFRQKFPSLFVYDPSGHITRLPTGGGDLNSAPDWSPDGKRIAYSSTRDGNCELYLLDIASGRDRRLTVNDAIDSSPSWSPTGREIAFTSDRSGTPQLYIMDADGASVRRLTYDGVWNDSAAWSPKGDKIAYVCRIEGKFVLMMLDLVTQKATRLLGGTFNCADPRWSPDGRHLTFASDRDGHYEIYTIDPDGGSLRRLTRGEPSFTPDWSR